jgi:hypothetical protein
MKFSASALLLASALGASAHPSGHHGHLHRSVDKRGHFFAAVKPEPTTTAAPAPVTTSSVAPPPPAPTSTSSAAPAPAASSAASSQLENNSESTSSSSGSAPAFCGGNYKRATIADVQPDISKRASLEDIAYAGNLGATGNYGCNLMEVEAKYAESYKYLTTFENDSDKDQECVCFLKIGPEGGINGFFNGNQAVDFSVPAGGKSYIAADENTQGGCACGHGSVPLTSFGEFASTWLEFDFGNEKNGAWSGADASCLVSAALGLDIPGLQVCGHDTCSTINPGGSGTNAYLGGMEAEDGVGLNIVPGEVRLNVKVAYQG